MEDEGEAGEEKEEEEEEEEDENLEAWRARQRDMRDDEERREMVMAKLRQVYRWKPSEVVSWVGQQGFARATAKRLQVSDSSSSFPPPRPPPPSSTSTTARLLQLTDLQASCWAAGVSGERLLLLTDKHLTLLGLEREEDRAKLLEAIRVLAGL
eukprot:767574-Hanusia_phi.AAC.6